MQLFKPPVDESKAEAKDELEVCAAYLGREHRDMLDYLLARGNGKLSKSEVVRQCLQLGYETLRAQESKRGEK